MDEFRALDMLGVEAMNHHERERALAQERTEGELDFVACLVIATNQGKHKLDGDSSIDIEGCFKPLGIRRDLARAPRFADASVNWLETLEFEVGQDHPVRSIA